MSGPKSSRYSLSLYQRQMLQEQLRKAREAQILEERKKNEIDVIRHSCQQLRDSVSELQEIIDQCKGFEKESSDRLMAVPALRLLCENALQEIKKAESIGTNKGLDQISQTSGSISSLMRKIHTERQKIVRTLEQRKRDFRDETIKNVASGFELSFVSISDKKALHENIYLNRIIEELDKLTDLAISDELRNEFDEIRKKADEIKSTDYLENFYSITVIPFVKKCKEYDLLDKKYGEDYKMLYLRYKYLAQELDHEIEVVPFSDQAVSILLEMIKNLETEELKIKEEAYICGCIDEVMTEMNYSVIGSRDVTKKSGKRFRNVLYKFDEGTAVNVTYSNDGQIAMELGGVGDEDRVPTDAESVSLEEDMRSFCEDYNEIEKKLKARGIECNTISHLPPKAQFAQIINISDFDMTGEIGQYEVKRFKRKQSGANRETLHREG